jgi:NAD(P)H dehydrogenase (quinone)
MDSTANVTIVYYSATGTVHQLAEAVRDGAAETGAEVRLRRVAETAPAEAMAANSAWMEHVGDTKHIPTVAQEDLTWADAVLFGTPTRFGNVSAQLKQFLDTLSGLWHQDKLSDKIYSGFTSTASTHGGQESTLLALYNSIYHFGGIIVTPGYKGHTGDSERNPYGASHVTGEDGSRPVDDAARRAAHFQGERVAGMAAALRIGLAGANLHTVA